MHLSIRNKCNKMNIEIATFKRYVYDIFIIMREILPNWQFNNNDDKMIDGNYDDTRSAEQRTFETIKEIANSIDSDIEMEVDHPSNNEDGMLPCLDVKVWMENNKCLFTFYKKPVSSTHTIIYRSAVSVSIKRNTILKEGLRRLKNTSPRLNR